MSTGANRPNAAFAALSVMSVAILLALSACSSSSSPPLLVGQPLTTKANAICDATAQKVKAGESVFPNPKQAGIQDASLIAKFATDTVLPALRQERDQLKKLSSEPDFQTMVHLLSRGIDRWTGDRTLMATVVDTSFTDFDMYASSMGMTSCSAIDGMVRRVSSGLIS